MRHKQKSKEMTPQEIDAAFGNIRKNLEAIVEKEKAKGDSKGKRNGKRKK